MLKSIFANGELGSIAGQLVAVLAPMPFLPATLATLILTTRPPPQAVGLRQLVERQFEATWTEDMGGQDLEQL